MTRRESDQTDQSETIDTSPLPFYVNLGHQDLVHGQPTAIGEDSIDLATVVGTSTNWEQRQMNLSLFINQLGNDIASLDVLVQLENRSRATPLTPEKVEERAQRKAVLKARLEQNANSVVEYINRVWGTFYKKTDKLTLDDYYNESLNSVALGDEEKGDPGVEPNAKMFTKRVGVFFSPLSLMDTKSKPKKLTFMGSTVQRLSQASGALKKAA